MKGTWGVGNSPGCMYRVFSISFLIMVFFIYYFLYLKRSKVNKKNAQELASVFSPTLFVITVNICPYTNSHYYNHILHSLLPCLTTAR